MKRAYKLRAYPTQAQECRAVRLLRDHCDLYNARPPGTTSVADATGEGLLRRSSAQLGRSARLIRTGRVGAFTAQQQTLRVACTFRCLL